MTLSIKEISFIEKLAKEAIENRRNNPYSELHSQLFDSTIKNIKSLYGDEGFEIFSNYYVTHRYTDQDIERQISKNTDTGYDEKTNHETEPSHEENIFTKKNILDITSLAIVINFADKNNKTLNLTIFNGFLKAIQPLIVCLSAIKVAYSFTKSLINGKDTTKATLKALYDGSLTLAEGTAGTLGAAVGASASSMLGITGLLLASAVPFAGTIAAAYGANRIINLVAKEFSWKDLISQTKNNQNHLER